MKLFYTPGACSLSPHIVVRESGAACDLVKVDLKAHKTEAGDDFYAVNPKGYIPTLQLDDGTMLTEGAAIVQYLADKAPGAKLIPAAGTRERYQAIEWLNFIATEIHKQFSPLFNPTFSEEVKTFFRNKVSGRFAWLDEILGKQAWVMGAEFSVVDAYLFNMTQWAVRVNVDLAQWPNLSAFRERMLARPAVQAAMKAEGLL
jgi:glutathione S-transferase